MRGSIASFDNKTRLISDESGRQTGMETDGDRGREPETHGRPHITRTHTSTHAHSHIRIRVHLHTLTHTHTHTSTQSVDATPRHATPPRDLDGALVV